MKNWPWSKGLQQANNDPPPRSNYRPNMVGLVFQWLKMGLEYEKFSKLVKDMSIPNNV